MNSQHSSSRPNSSSLKSRFTLGFLRALKRLNRQPSSSSSSQPQTVSSPREMCRRYLRIRIAADASMASAVGSRRAWSRALLLKIRSRQSRSSNSSARRVSMKKKCLGEKIKKKKKLKCCKEIKKLRKFVPGGEAMDACSLLDEAGHYIRCLNTQVKVMTRIVDNYSAN
ncbi:putative transcription factor bHLH family [Rosa chinensis]|uniref:Putative transcription factor bHLH family n=1 Tax=Rosa chinensis TaxID=74649 RepID=A0A2P6PTW4_ROSCH|nr:putative transcription factor bHLH family [Rosa chinensis]